MQNSILTGTIAGVLVVAVGVVAVWALYEDGGNARSGRPATANTASGSARLMVYDGDKDGRLTRNEVDLALAAEFRAVDANSDGRLDPAELQRFSDRRRLERRARYEAWRLKAAAQGLDLRKPPSDLVPRDNVDTLRFADWNLDGVVTPDEFGGRARAQFMRSDRNGDGVIDEQELKRRASAKRNSTPARRTT